MLFCLLALVLGVFVVAGAPRLESNHFVPFLSHGVLGMLAAVPLLVSLFLGIESATEVGDEIRDVRRVISRGIAISVGVTLFIYGAVSIVALGSVGADALAGSSTPLLLAAESVLGPTAKYFIVLAATLAITKSLNAILIIFSRYLFAMGRSGTLPVALGRIHPKWGTPHVAITVAFGCCVLGLLLPTDLVFLFLAVNIPTMIKYLATCLSALRVLKAHPQVYAGAGFRPAPGALKAVSVAGAISAALIIAVGVDADWRPYVVLLAWAAVGLAYWLLRPATRAAVPGVS
jgi:APA family basic amino acid/polyamine antiporter